MKTSDNFDRRIERPRDRVLMDCPHSEISSEDEAESRKKRIIKEYQTLDVIDNVIGNKYRQHYQ
jgi:hypothetical protein